MSRFFKVLYVLFIIVCIIYPFKPLVTPITFRHLISIMMLALCIMEGFHLDKYLILYLVFLFFLGVSSLVTGYIGVFLNKFFGTYIPMIAVYASTYLLIKKYNGKSILLWLFVGIGLFNALITIGQFFHLGIIDTLYSSLHLDISEDFLDLSERKELEGFAVPGLLNYVINGYFLSATALLVLYNKQDNIIFNLSLWLIVLVASLLAQERTGFFLAIAFSFYIIVMYFFSKGKKTGYVMTGILLVLFSVLVFTYLDDLLSSNLRFSKGLINDNRAGLRADAWDYFLKNPLGGYYEFDASGKGDPHNYFVNAFLYGGLFGGISIILLLILQVIKIIPYLFKNYKSENSQYAFIWGLMYVDYSLNSMIHNASIILGTFTFFVWWGAFLAFADMDSELVKKRSLTT